MSTKQPAQPTAEKQAQSKRAEAPEVTTAGLEQAAVTADPSHLSLAGMPPDMPTARPLRQAYVLQMQRRYGNAYVQRMLAGHIQAVADGPALTVADHPPASVTPSPAVHFTPPPSLGRSSAIEAAPDETIGGDELVGMGSSGRPTAAAASDPPPDSKNGYRGRGQPAVVVQAKLAVTAPGDRYEQEADQVAEAVMRSAESPPAVVVQRPAGPAPAATEVTPEVESQIQRMRGGGQPLPETERRFFEPRFGHDFSQVRVHTDRQSVQLSQELAARAFTVGRDVAFAPEQYAPGTAEGRRLLAHELTHVVQQGAAGESVQRQVNGQGHSPRSPEEDPAFQAVAERTRLVAGQEKTHEPAPTAAGAAQAAAQGPANEVSSQAAAGQVAEMDQQEPKPFDRAAFKAALLEKIAAATPSTLEEADEFADNNQLDSIRGELASNVEENQAEAQGDIEEKAEEAPDTSGIQPKEVIPLTPAEAGPAPADVGAAGAVPKPKTEAEVNTPFEEGSQSLDQQMAEAEITEEQLEKSNEPEFQSALEQKEEAQTDAAEAPAEYRQAEEGTLTAAQGEAEAEATTQTQAMHGEREQLLTEVAGQQSETQSQDEQARAEVADHIEQIYEATRQQVEERLSQLDSEVDEAFTTGAAEAKQAFEDYVEARMDQYKDERYSGIEGAAQWVVDKIMGMPPEVNAFYQAGRDLYIRQMDGVLDNIAGVVETGLTEAKAEIAQGRQEVQEYVNSLPAALRQVGQEAAQAIQSRFDDLDRSVEEKQQQLIDSLAQRYNESLQEIDSRIEELQAENRGLIDAAMEAMGGVIQTILELKEMLSNVLSRAAAAIDKIIQDPIGFLGNLVAGVKQGLDNFVANIGQHLQEGLMGWLFGAMAEAGIQMPDSFDLKGILSLVLQVLGLTYQNIRARAVAILGEEVVARLEQVAEIFQVLITEGPAGLWEWIKEKIGNFKDTIIEEIKQFVIERVIVAGITWIIGLLNPASAFVKACKAIYDIIMFFVERGSQIMALVNAVIDSVTAIADGAIGVAASAVENALSRALPVAISFLASLLGLGGISDKIREVIEKIRAPINTAIDWVINKAVDLVRAAGQLLGFGGEEEGGEAAEGEEEESPEVTAGLAALHGEEYSLAGEGGISREEAERIASDTRSRHPVFQSISVVDGGGKWNYDYVVARTEEPGSEPKEAGSGELLERVRTLKNRAYKLADETGQADNAELANIAAGCEQIEQDLNAGQSDVAVLSRYGTELTRLEEQLSRLEVELGEGHPDKKYVDTVNGQYTLKPEYQQNIRDRFYKKKFRADRRSTVLARASAGNGMYHCENQGTLGPNHKPLLNANEVTIEHTASVVDHWNNQGGNNMTQDERNEWYDDPDHLQVFCESCNKSRPGGSGGNYLPSVGPNFRGP